MGYEQDRKWSDKFIPKIKQVIGPLLLEESSFEVDTEEAADLIVLNVLNMRIAARVRRFGYAEKYQNEFTIRNFRKSGAKTEMEKIVEGFGDWLLYGHSDEIESDFIDWMIVDLNALRAALIRKKRHLFNKKIKMGTTGFVAFNVTKLPIQCMVARK